MTRAIQIPNAWQPRDYQLPVLQAFENGIKRFILVYHRRAGKDSLCINMIALACFRRVANYLYLFPTQVQARKAMWEAIDRQGRRVIDQAFPEPLRETVRNDQMFIRLKNGSTVQISGADQFDSLVGTNYAGIVFSEYAITSPQTWRYLSPILAENDGFAIFNSTPRGRNHLYDLYETNKDNKQWYVQLASVEHTKAIPLSVIEDDIRAGMPPEVARQEYYCSFDAPNVGRVYARQMEQARRDNRITSVPYNAAYPVECWFDIGHRDATAVWFAQRINGFVNLIDYLEDRGKGLPFYANELNKKPYSYSRHIGPHDLDNKVWAIDGTTKQIAANHGLNFTVAPKLPIKDGIDAARALFSQCRFDAGRCAEGLRALDHYEFAWDEEKRIFGDKPVHDWSSHGADAFRYGSVTPDQVGIIPVWARDIVRPTRNGPSFVPNIRDQVTDYDPLGYFRG